MIRQLWTQDTQEDLNASDPRVHALGVGQAVKIYYKFEK